MAFWRSRKSTPEFLAREIYNTFVADGVKRDLLDHNLFDAPQRVWPALSAKLGTYRKAAVLYVLFRAAPSSKKADATAIAYGRLIFGSTPTERGQVSIDEVESARIEIAHLIEDSVDLPVMWAKEWLASVGLTEENPIALSQFCFHWMEVVERATCGIIEVTKD